MVVLYNTSSKQYGLKLILGGRPIPYIFWFQLKGWVDFELINFRLRPTKGGESIFAKKFAQLKGGSTLLIKLIPRALLLQGRALLTKKCVNGEAILSGTFF